MIEINDSSSDESSDVISSVETAHSSSGVGGSFTLCSTLNIKYDASSIKHFLKNQPEKYTLVDNPKTNTVNPSPCWTRFGLPAFKDENNRSIIISKFATCRSCYSTYSYSNGSTKSLNAHKCAKEPSSPSVSRSSSTMLKSPFLSTRINRFFAEKKKTLTPLITKWICQNMRPICIVEDEGFLNIIEHCLTINGGPVTNVNEGDIIPSRWAISREIARQANDIRESLSVELINAAKQDALTISPDLWSDKFKQNNYLGLTAHFVDENHVLHVIDLCCEPYNEINKRADSILRAITAALSKFGLDTFMDKIVFVCDRGSNLVKALEDFKVVHCFPHRLNNVLKRTFYSAGTEEKILKRKRKTVSKKKQADDQLMFNNCISNDDDLLMDYDDRDSSESESDDNIILDAKCVESALRSLSSSSSPERDHVNIIEQNLPLHASQLLATVVRCKQLCCYVKRVNWNPMLEELGKPTIKQEIIVRWLTMSQLLESILSSYSALTTIASKKGVLHTLPSIDVSTVASIVGLFAPWKHVIKRVQTTNTPSLHLVVTSYWYILESLIVTKDESADKAAKGVVFFKTRARQLLKSMFTLDDLHWIAEVLNPRTRMLKLATDAERTYAHSLVRSEMGKIIAIEGAQDNRSVESPAVVSPSPHKKFKSYTEQFDDDVEYNEPNIKLNISMRTRREMETYLQMKLPKTTTLNDDNDNPLLFWKEQENLLPNLSKLSKKIFRIPASSAAVERTFSSAGVIISQRRTNINPSTLNDIILIRSAANRSKKNK